VRGEAHVTKLGQIWGNFHSLEMVLRSYLAFHDPRKALKEGQSFETLAVGDVVGENPTTDFSSLGQLIEQFNKAVSKNRRIDPTLVDLRDALAHGRVWSLDETFPLRLLKFSRPDNGRVTVTWASTMTDDWLNEQRQRVLEALVRAYGGAPS